MKKKIILFLLLLFTLSACSNDKNALDNTPLYEGKKLTIGVVGKPPKVREENIVFEVIELKDLYKDTLSSKYDAVFIMKEHLSEAAKLLMLKFTKVLISHSSL